MSYYTKFELGWSKPFGGEVSEDDDLRVLSALSKTSLSEGKGFWNGELLLGYTDFHEFIQGLFEEDMEWDDWPEDMRKVSEECPDLLFELHGEGENMTDVWRCYFFRERSQYVIPKITWPPCDMDKLIGNAEK